MNYIIGRKLKILLAFPGVICYNKHVKKIEKKLNIYPVIGTPIDHKECARDKLGDRTVTCRKGKVLKLA